MEIGATIWKNIQVALSIEWHCNSDDYDTYLSAVIYIYEYTEWAPNCCILWIWEAAWNISQAGCCELLPRIVCKVHPHPCQCILSPKEKRVQTWFHNHGVHWLQFYIHLVFWKLHFNIFCFDVLYHNIYAHIWGRLVPFIPALTTIPLHTVVFRNISKACQQIIMLSCPWWNKLSRVTSLCGRWWEAVYCIECCKRHIL